MFRKYQYHNKAPKARIAKEVPKALTVEEQEEKRQEYIQNNKNYIEEDGQTKQSKMKKEEEIPKWIERGFKKVEFEELEELVKKSTFLKYIRKADQHPVGGGKLIKYDKEGQYIRLLSFLSSVGTISVQLENISEIYVRPIEIHKKVNENEQQEKIKILYEEAPKEKKKNYNNLWKYLQDEYEEPEIYKKQIIYFYKNKGNEVLM